MNIFIILTFMALFVYFYFIMTTFFAHRKVFSSISSLIIYNKHLSPFLSDFLLDSQYSSGLTSFNQSREIRKESETSSFCFCYLPSCSKMDIIFQSVNLFKIYSMLTFMVYLELSFIFLSFGDF